MLALAAGGGSRHVFVTAARSGQFLEIRAAQSAKRSLGSLQVFVSVPCTEF
jgi:hypothetical protein